MLTSTITVDPAYVIGEIDPRMRGSFVEHLGRCVYTGIYEPGHTTADGDGFRFDVRDLTRDLGVSIVRYPGGNFVSGYRWEDGVGPREERPTKLDLAFQSIETNAVGIGEFMAWTRTVGAEAMMAVNLGTRGVEEAAALVEYCNHPGGGYWSDLRHRHGRADPYGIGVWCLGNELDGPWQIGRKPAREYGILAAAAGAAMRRVDPSIQLVACGSSGRRMATYAAWEAEVLEHTYEVVDYISVHAYHGPRGDTRADYVDFMAAGADMDAMITQVIGTSDYVGAKLKSRKRLNLSFDEWNVRHTHGTWRQGHEPWTVAPPLIEDTHSVTDAVVVGSMLNSLLRHADRVTMSCFAQLVNIHAPIRTAAGGPAWRQASYYPMQAVFAHSQGQSIRLAVESPPMTTQSYGDVDQVDAAATRDEDGSLTVFVVNRSLDDAVLSDVVVRAMGQPHVTEHVLLHDDDPDATNTHDHPDRVRPRHLDPPGLDGGRLQVMLPPRSWQMIRIVDDAGRRNA
nr:alpha-N-arabinofuranosidase [Ruania alba]